MGHEARIQAAQLDSISHLKMAAAPMAVSAHSVSLAGVEALHTVLSEQLQPHFALASQ